MACISMTGDAMDSCCSGMRDRQFMGFLCKTWAGGTGQDDNIHDMAVVYIVGVAWRGVFLFVNTANTSPSCRCAGLPVAPSHGIYCFSYA